MLLAALLAFARLAAMLRRVSAKKRVRPHFSGDRPLRAAFFSAYPEGHYGTVSRLSSWVGPLAREGIEVEVFCPSTAEEFAGFGKGDPEADRTYLDAARANRRIQIESAADFDVVFLHRGLFPYGPWQRATFERILARLNPHLIFDFYDSIWLYRRETHAAARGRLGRWLNPPDLVETICRTAAEVTVSSEHLAEFVRDAGSRVHLLPMVVDPSTYPVREAVERTPVVLGWMGSHYNLSRVRGIAPAIRDTAREVPLRLRIVSSAPLAIEGVEVEMSTHPWSPETEREDLASFDIGLLPMEDSEVDRGKSPLKLLQYGAAGLPIVSSRVAVDQGLFVNGQSILFADTEQEWTEALILLAGNVELRRSMGAAARRVIETHYSFAAHAEHFAALLTGVASR